MLSRLASTVTGPFTLERRNQLPDSTLPVHVQTSWLRPTSCAGSAAGSANASESETVDSNFLIGLLPLRCDATCAALDLDIAAESLEHYARATVADAELEFALVTPSLARPGLERHGKIAVHASAERLQAHCRSGGSRNRKRQPSRVCRK